MKRLLTLLAVLVSTVAVAQNAEPPARQWSFYTDINFYFIPEDFFVLPVIGADHKKLHLEGRYNYEDRNTFSAWAGYNFEGGKSLQYIITPMGSVVFGQTNGVAAGLIIELTFKRFVLRNEAEYLFDSESVDSNFFYNWADVTYSFNDWLSFGVSGQRLRSYQTDLDLQRGVMISFAGKNLEAAVYLYNPGLYNPFLLLTLSAEF